MPRSAPPPSGSPVVLDATAWTDLLLGTPGRAAGVARALAGAGGVAVLDLTPMAVLDALGRARRAAPLPFPDHRAPALVMEAPFRVAPSRRLAERAWELELSAGCPAGTTADVALAEALGLPLVTTDPRLARAAARLPVRIVDCGRPR